MMIHGRSIALTLAAGLAFDLLSIIGWTHPPMGTAVSAVLLIGVLLASVRDLRWGIAGVLVELVWGSHGHALTLVLGDRAISLRVALFAVVLLATLVHVRRVEVRTAFVDAMRTHPVRWPFAAFLGTLVISGILGVTHHPLGRFVGDVNAWGFLALAPAFLIAAVRRPERSFLILPALYLVLRTYALLFLFSHDLREFWVPLYQWVRDTRLGEVTVFPGGFPRVFIPSMVLLFPAILLAGRELLTLPRVRDTVPQLALIGGGIAVLVLSLSRSYWLALVGIAALGLIMRARYVYRRSASRLAIGAAAVFGGLAMAALLVRLPFPAPLTTGGFGSTFASRIASDAAVSNRWQQLPPLRAAISEHPFLGNGFGAAVTYESRDLRTLAAFPDGKYTTTAFEWGYLDDALERGIIGLFIELWFIGALIWYGIRRGGETAALALGLLAIALVHATSPYLNHPLGIGMILLVFAATARNRVLSPEL